MVLGRLADPEGARTIDRALAVWFPGPASHTGEDCAEIHCHGGATVPALVLEAVLAAGARLARPGEFTQRAFLSGRMSLDQAEAVAELVAARSAAEAALAARHLEGALGARIRPLERDLKAVRASLSASLDFLDDEFSEADKAALAESLAALVGELRGIAALGREGRIYRDGLRVVLAGPPNAGKSSLFNALLGRDRALVNPRPGTTRDYLEASAAWSDVRVELVDTAGLRGGADDEIERLGQELARRELERADVALWLMDLSDPAAPGPPADVVSALGERLLIVGSKADLTPIGDSERRPLAGDRPSVSAVTGSGLAALQEAVLARAGVVEGPGPEVVPNLRQRRAVEDCLARLEAAASALEAGLPPDVVDLELRDASAFLGLVTGATLPEDLLEEIFSRFCLGK
jgi:tRNA modification GTPase